MSVIAIFEPYAPGLSSHPPGFAWLPSRPEDLAKVDGGHALGRTVTSQSFKLWGTYTPSFVLMNDYAKILPHSDRPKFRAEKFTDENPDSGT